MLDYIKRHPYVAAIGVFVVGIILVVMFTGSESAPANTYVMDDSSATASGTALQLAQLQAQTDVANINAGAGVAQQQIAMQLTLGQLQIQQQQNSDTLAASIASSQIAASKETTQLISTLTAQVQNNQINAQIQGAQIASATTIKMAEINTGAITTILSQQAAERQRAQELQYAYAIQERGFQYSENLHQQGVIRYLIGVNGSNAAGGAAQVQ